MNNDIGYIHHVGHVVHNIAQARECYRRLGFLCPAPAYPTLERNAGELATPFGVANMHASFVRNFIEIMAVVTEESTLPDDAQPIPLQIPPAALPRVVESMERTIAKISTSLNRFEGLHILVFQTEDANETARRFDMVGVGHSGVNRVQQPGQAVPMGVIEIDREPVPEGRLAVAEAPVGEPSEKPSSSHHLNGAVDLVESILCIPDAEVESYVKRYQRYIGRIARREDATYIFDLRDSCVRLIPERQLGELLPGETVGALPAFVGYVVAVRDLNSTRQTLERNGLAVHDTSLADIFVSAKDALGATVIFRQA